VAIEGFEAVENDSRRCLVLETLQTNDISMINYKVYTRYQGSSLTLELSVTFKISTPSQALNLMLDRV
jgi:hypothetical protein